MNHQNKPEVETQHEAPGTAAGKTASPQSSKTTSKLRRILPKVLFVLTLAAAITFAGLWWQERSSTDSAQLGPAASGETSASEDRGSLTCPDAFTHYASSDYQLEFCYPISWGEVTVKDESGPVAEAGKLAEFTFTDREHTWLHLPTRDWQMMAGHGGCGFPPLTRTEQLRSWSTRHDSPQNTAYSWPQPDDGSDRLAHGDRTLSTDALYSISESISTYEYLQGVCITGYKVLGGDTYQLATAVRRADFNDQINTPQKHVDNPDTLVPARERSEFTEFVKSIRLQRD